MTHEKYNANGSRRYYFSGSSTAETRLSFKDLEVGVAGGWGLGGIILTFLDTISVLLLEPPK